MSKSSGKDTPTALPPKIQLIAQKTKAFRKKDDEVGKLEQLVRELKSKNRNLVKKLKRLNKGYHKYKDVDEFEEEEQPRKKKEICKECGTGEIEIIDVVGRMFRKCKLCEHRVKI